jgi:hypothetical protein
MNNTNVKAAPSNGVTTLDIATAQQIGGAIQRLREIGSSVIIDPKNEAEQKALNNYLATTLPQYANELLACWIAVRNEYEPLINSCRAIFGRAFPQPQLIKPPTPDTTTTTPAPAAS